jgi:putative ATP-dependent endonuclease of OLD family
LPASVKHKRYRQDFRTRFCEGLLASRILIAEGATEAASFPVAARRLAEIDSSKYVSLEALGICTIDAGSETQIADLAGLYRGLGKKTFGLCDKQSDENKAAIETQVDELFMHDEKGFENLVLKGTTQPGMERFADVLEWPEHILAKYPAPKADVVAALGMYFGWAKGNWGIAEFLAQCSEAEIPEWIRNACASLKQLFDPPPILKTGAACADEMPPTEPTTSG